MRVLLLCIIAIFISPSNFAIAAPSSGAQCDDMTGKWENNVIEEQISLTQSGCSIGGILVTDSHQHSFSGTIHLQTATIDIVRRSRVDGCVTTMHSAWVVKGDTARRTITGTDGKCDLPVKFSNVYDYERKPNWT